MKTIVVILWFGMLGPLLQAGDSGPLSLRGASTGLFTIGVGINDRIPDRPADWPLLLTQFNAITPRFVDLHNPVWTSFDNLRDPSVLKRHEHR
jgi:hypothetical protein